MKLCKDCKFFAEASNKEAFCLHPEAVMYDDPIYGEHSKQTCRQMRIGYPELAALCGLTGKLWIASAAFTKQEYSTL